MLSLVSETEPSSESKPEKFRDLEKHSKNCGSNFRLRLVEVNWLKAEPLRNALPD